MKSMFRRAAAASLLALLVAVAPVAQATVVQYLTLADHIQLSNLVVRVNVGESRVYLHEIDGRPRTETQLTVVETYKGDAVRGQTLTVRQMRGTIGTERMVLAGDPELRKGQHLVLFLSTDETGMAYLTALGQSLYRVEPNFDGSGSLVIRDLDGLGFYMGQTPGKQGRIAHGTEEAPIPLDLFGTTIREIAREVAR